MPAGRYPELDGKVALVTGAGRDQGIGAAICRRLASEGCRVVVTDGRPQNLIQVRLAGNGQNQS